MTSRRADTVLGHMWSNWWFVLYLLSLLTWKLPNTWFNVLGWEATGKIYEWLGVRWFKQFMIGGDLHNRRIRRQIGGYRAFAASATLEEFKQQSIVSEKVHVIMFLFELWPTVLAFLWKWWAVGVALIACNVVINVYPIMLQRYTRGRIAMLKPRAVN